MECGIAERPSTPHSALRIPHLLVGALLLVLLPSPAGAQQPDSTLKDTTTLAPVVVTGTRLPSVHEVVRGLTGRTATLTSSDLDERGVRSLADALEELPGVTTSDALGAPAQLDVTLRGFQVSPTIGLPQGVTVYVDGVRMKFPEGWGLIRASNTQPVLVLRFEASTAEKLAEYRGIVERTLAELRSAVGA